MIPSPTALRDDLQQVITEGIDLHKDPRTIANRCIHILILHKYNEGDALFDDLET